MLFMGNYVDVCVCVECSSMCWGVGRGVRKGIGNVLVGFWFDRYALMRNGLVVA